MDTQLHHLMEALQRDPKAVQQLKALLGAPVNDTDKSPSERMRDRGFIPYSEAAERLGTTEQNIENSVYRGRYYGTQRWVKWQEVMDYVMTYGYKSTRARLKAWLQTQHGSTATVLSVAHRSDEPHEYHGTPHMTLVAS